VKGGGAIYMGIKMKGFDDFRKKLKQMQNATKDLEKGVSVSFDELFHEGFMRKYTNFTSIDEFFDKSPFEIQTEEDFDKIDINQFDEYIRNNTQFSSWEEMKGKAGTEWVAKKLGF